MWSPVLNSTSSPSCYYSCSSSSFGAYTSTNLIHCRHWTTYRPCVAALPLFRVSSGVVLFILCVRPAPSPDFSRGDISLQPARCMDLVGIISQPRIFYTPRSPQASLVSANTTPPSVSSPGLQALNAASMLYMLHTARHRHLHRHCALHRIDVADDDSIYAPSHGLRNAVAISFVWSQFHVPGPRSALQRAATIAATIAVSSSHFRTPPHHQLSCCGLRLRRRTHPPFPYPGSVLRHHHGHCGFLAASSLNVISTPCICRLHLPRCAQYPDHVHQPHGPPPPSATTAMRHRQHFTYPHNPRLLFSPEASH